MCQQQFIMVFRPHQRPAWAEAFDSEQGFVDAWVNGRFDRSCNATGVGEQCGDDEPTFADATEAVGHDLWGLTQIEDQAECMRYINEPAYCGAHNRGVEAVTRIARELGWLPAEESDSDEFDGYVCSVYGLARCGYLHGSALAYARDVVREGGQVACQGPSYENTESDVVTLLSRNGCSSGPEWRGTGRGWNVWGKTELHTDPE